MGGRSRIRTSGHLGKVSLGMRVAFFIEESCSCKEQESKTVPRMICLKEIQEVGG